MTLSRKTLVYTFVINLILMMFFTAYLLWLLPGLYVDHVNNQYVSQFQDGHLAYLGLGDEVETTSSMSNMIQVVIPKSGNQFLIHSSLGDYKLTIRDQRLMDKINQLKEAYTPIDKPEDIIYEDNAFGDLLDDPEFHALFDEALQALPLKIETLRSQSFESSDDVRLFAVRQVSDDTSLVAFEGTYDSNNYMNLMAVTSRDTDYVLSWASVVTGSIQQILPVTMQSLPMIALVVLGVVALASYLFSQRIVQPISQVSHQARTMMKSNYQSVEPLKLNSQDEIGQLAIDLDDLYNQLQTQYHSLAKEHERQEVFLRSGSHQLKTPITASLLLVDGMMGQVGKYANVSEHLPTLRARLQQMQVMVDSLLDAQAVTNDLKLVAIELHNFLDQRLPPYRELAESKDMSITITGERRLETEPDLLGKVFDCLLGNAISYTAPGGQVMIQLGDKVVIENSPALIDPAVIEHALEPFVSSNLESGRGLGLYIAKMTANLLGLKLDLQVSD